MAWIHNQWRSDFSMMLLNSQHSSNPKSWKAASFEFGKAYWQELLTFTNGDITKAASLAGVNRTDVYRRLMRYGINFKYVGYSSKGNAAWQQLGR